MTGGFKKAMRKLISYLICHVRKYPKCSRTRQLRKEMNLPSNRFSGLRSLYMIPLVCR